jgi:chloramphenicol 3-O-phosphotransferase
VKPGKTTLAKALQRRLDEPYLHLGSDQFLHPHAPEGLVAVSDCSAQAEGWLHGMYAGNHVIADLVIHDERIWRAAVDVFHPLPASSTVRWTWRNSANRRARNGEHRACFMKGCTGDLRVETALSSPDEGVERIQANPPTAFRRLHQERAVKCDL